MFQKKGDIPTLKNIKLRSSVLVQVLIRPLSIEVEANKRRNLCLSLFVTSSRTPFTALQTVSSDMKVKQRQSNATHASRSFNASSSIGLICFSLISQMVRLMSFAILPHWSMRSRKSSLFFIVSFEHGRPFNNVFLTMDKIYLDGKQDRRGCGQYRFADFEGHQVLHYVDGPDNAGQRVQNLLSVAIGVALHDTVFLWHDFRYCSRVSDGILGLKQTQPIHTYLQLVALRSEGNASGSG